MHRTAPVILGLAIAASAASADVKVLTDVPSYIWYYGCGPAAAGMAIAYWREDPGGGEGGRLTSARNAELEAPHRRIRLR